MPRLISRAIGSYHLQVEITQELPGAKELTHLVNQDSSHEEIGASLLQLYSSLSTPKLFEKRMVQALLSLPLHSNLAFKLVSEMVIELIVKQRIPFFPDTFRKNLVEELEYPPLDPDEDQLFQTAFELVKEGKADFKQLLELVHFQQDCLPEALFRFILQSQQKNTSQAVHNVLFAFCTYCPDDMKEDLLKQPFQASQLKCIQTDLIHGMWKEIQSFAGKSVVKDLFLYRNWNLIQHFPHNDLQALIQKCLDYQLHTKYPLVWRDWIAQAQINSHFPFIIQQLFARKDFSALAPLIDLNHPYLLKIIREEFRKLPEKDQDRFCFEALKRGSRSFAEPFLLQLIKRANSLPQLEAIGRELCKRHTYLCADLHLKTLGLSTQSLGIRLSAWQKEYLKNAPKQDLSKLFRVLSHAHLAKEAKNEMLLLLLPIIPEIDVPAWFKLIDDPLSAAPLPPLFEVEKNRRQADEIKRRISCLKEPDDAMLCDGAHLELLFDHVLNSGSFPLKAWLLEKGNLQRANYRRLLVSAYQQEPNEVVNTWMRSFIENSASLDDLRAICLEPGLVLPVKFLKAISSTLSRIKPDPLLSVDLFRFFLEKVKRYFPWEHFFSLLVLDPAVCQGITTEIAAMQGVFPSNILELIEKCRNEYRDPKTLVLLFELTSNFQGSLLQSPRREMLETLTNHHPQDLAYIRPNILLKFINDFQVMDADTCITLGHFFAAIKITSRFKKAAQLYCRQLLMGTFGNATFTGWATDEISRREQDWGSVNQINLDFDIKQLYREKSLNREKPIHISFDFPSLQRRILDEQVQALQNIPDEKQKETFRRSIVATFPLANPSRKKVLTWQLHPRKNRELIYIFIEETATLRPAVPYVISFKNAFCRSVIRDVFNSLQDWDHRRLQAALLNCFKGNSLPLNYTSTLETWGYKSLGVHIASFGSMSLNDRAHYLQCINILSTGAPYTEHTDDTRIRSAFESVFFELLNGESLNLTICAEKTLETNKKYIPEDEYHAFKEICVTRILRQLPSTLNDPFHCSVLLHKFPELLFECVPLLTAGLLDTLGKCGLCNNASSTYNLLWTVRRNHTPSILRESLHNDIEYFSPLIKLGKELNKIDSINGLCSQWCAELLKYLERGHSIQARDKKRIGLDILIMFQLFNDFFEKNTDVFFNLWKISRDYLCPLKSAQQLMQHNKLTERYRHILRAEKLGLLSHFTEEAKSLETKKIESALMQSFISSFNTSFLKDTV